jgi:hypothetical protein
VYVYPFVPTSDFFLLILNCLALETWTQMDANIRNTPDSDLT